MGLAAVMLMAGLPASASAQDGFVAGVLQRVCLPTVSGSGNDRAPWRALPAVASAEGLTLKEHSNSASLGLELWVYEASRADGVYEVVVARNPQGSTGSNCSIAAPSTQTRAELERAVGGALGPEWTAQVDDDGREWSRPHPAIQDRRLRVRVEAEDVGAFSVDLASPRRR
jgi:hypothetical protein